MIQEEAIMESIIDIKVIVLQVNSIHHSLKPLNQVLDRALDNKDHKEEEEEAIIQDNLQDLILGVVMADLSLKDLVIKEVQEAM